MISPDQLQHFDLQNGDLSVGVLNYGARTTYLRYQGIDLALFYPNIGDYLTGIPYVGAIVGRIANRIGGAAFNLQGKSYALTPNERKNQLHGGPNGLSQQLWTLEKTGAGCRFTYHSEDQEEGYPAAVDFKVELQVGPDFLEYHMTANSDAPCPINLAQHNYYAIDLEKAHLRLCADRYTPVDDEQIPTGEMLAVKETDFDYQTLRKIDAGIDHNLALSGSPAAYLETKSCALTFISDQPGIQVYSGAGLSAPFKSNSGLALEPQYFPNAINTPQFEMPLTTPETPYSQKLRIEFSQI